MPPRMWMPRTKRLILLLLAYAVGGAIINVAVAWGYIIRFDVNSAKTTDVYSGIGTDEYRWGIERTTGAICSARSYFSKPSSTIKSPFVVRPEELIPPWSTLPRAPDEYEVSSGQSQQQLDVAAGWPILSLHSRSLWLSGPPMPRIVEIHGGIETAWFDRSTDLAKVLPLSAIWPGFAINTIFYAAILWLLVAAPFALRRRLVIRGRVRRGQCPACAYPVGTSTVCTECGKAVK